MAANRKVILFVIFSFLTGSFLISEDQLSLSIDPTGSLPLGSSADSFNFGFGSNLNINYSFGLKKIFNVHAVIDYLYLPLQTQDGISLISGGLGPYFTLPVSDRLSFSLGGSFGYYYWFPTGWSSPGSNGGGFTFSGDLSGAFSFNDSVDLHVAVGYDYYSNLYNGLSFIIGTRIKLTDIQYPVRTPREDQAKPQLLEDRNDGIDLDNFAMDPVFPILYKYYDNNPLGRVTLTNYESNDITDIKVTFFVERYMDNPMDVGAPDELRGKEQIEIDLYGLFTEDVMTITEGNKASAKVLIEYTLKKKTYTQEYNPVIEFHNRNALTWDDDNKIAAFVNSKDPGILAFSRNVTNWMQEEKNSFVDENLQKAIVIFETIKQKRIRYEIDPATPFSELSENALSVDFLQFPRQTLNYTSGDCDDLSILFASMLEASGVETAFVTIPGHIYLAFALKMTSDNARRNFTQSDNLIFIDDKVWFPLEITMLQDDFLDAWETGAKEWRENKARELSGFYPTRTAWQTYQAVGFSDDSSAIPLPSKSEVLSGFSQTLRTFINREIYPQVARIQAKIKERGGQIKYSNQLAVLYARYGLLDMAEDEFKAIVRSEEYLPALINLGNIFYLKKDYLRALTFYERAEEVNSQNKTVVLSIAKVHHELENYGMVKQKYSLLEDLAPSLALEFAYLDLRGDEATRAADISGAKEVMLWEEEE